MHPVKMGLLQVYCNTQPAREAIARVLLGVLVAVVVLGDLPVVHDHDAPGLYNEDCPLVRLAAAAPTVPLPQARGIPLPLPAPDGVPASPVLGSAVIRLASFESRAPPVLVPRRHLAP